MQGDGVNDVTDNYKTTWLHPPGRETVCLDLDQSRRIGREKKERILRKADWRARVGNSSVSVLHLPLPVQRRSITML